MRRSAGIALVLVAMAGCKPETEISTIHPTISVAPEAVDFGAAVAPTEDVQGETFTQDLEIQNVGLAVLKIDLDAPDDAAFTFAGAPHLELGVDESATVTLSFAPTELKDYASTLVIHSPDDPDHKEVDIPLTGTGRVPYAPDIEVTPTDLSWSDGYNVGDYVLPQLFSIANVGDADLVLGSITQEGAGVFVMVPDYSGAVIAPGESRAAEISYNPLLTDADGTIVIPSNDPDEPITTVTLTAGAGGAGEYPKAVITGCESGEMDLNLIGSTVVALDGSNSTDPFGYGLTYAWSVVRRPNAADTTRTVDPGDQVAGTLLVDTAGLWEVQLIVTDEIGLPSPPAKCVIKAIPTDAIHVELSWGGPTSDMDLHLSDGSAFYDVPGDVSWCNKNPDWGTPGDPADDGHLDLDDADGFGPEVVGVTVPADGTYPVRVHFFDDGLDGPTTATVSVFLNANLVWTGSKVLERNQVWEVGQVNWPDATFGTSDQLWDAEDLRGCFE